MTTKNTTLVSNFEATPQVITEAHSLHGVLRVAQGTVALAAGDSTDNDIVMLAPIPSNASITALKIASDSLGGTCTFNVGLYTTGGTVVDEDVYATLVADEGAMTDVRSEADITTVGQQVWEDAGASSDPGGYYYVAVTFSATGGTAGDMSFVIEYVVN
jgi:expansin (peptidoglycan-binding protein)